MKAWALAALAVAVLAAAARPKSGGVSLAHVVDLTHVLSRRFPIVPVPGLTFPFEQRPIASLEKNHVYAEEWRLIPHDGTHMDAPIHYVEGGRSMAGIRAEELIAPAVVIDIHQKAARDPDAQLTIGDVEAFEKRNGRIPPRSVVLMYSGWDVKATTEPAAFVGLDGNGRTHFPTLSPAAVDLLVRERDIAGVGVDTLSFDPIDYREAPAAHQALLGADRWGIECVNNLSRIPPAGATVFAGALKVEGASASPIRLIAVW